MSCSRVAFLKLEEGYLVKKRAKKIFIKNIYIQTAAINRTRGERR
jgi:hypothetical protein